MVDCVLCHREVKGNVNHQRAITCGRCVLILVAATRDKKIALLERLTAAGRVEEARAVESFISPEEDAIDEPTKKFRRVVVRKRPLRKVRPPRRKRPFSRDQLLDQGWAEIG